MSLHINALITVAEAKAHIGIASGDTTHDTLLETLIAEVSDFIDTYTSRTLREQTGVSLRARGNGMILALPQYPVASVASVTDEDGAVTPAGDYRLLADSGILKSKGGDWGGLDYTVVCTCGYKTAGQTPSDLSLRTVPYALVLACAKLVAKAFERRHAEGTSNTSIGQVSVGYQRELDTEVSVTLDAHKKAYV